MAISTDTLLKETDARFWSQTGYKPGQKLDPKNPTDKAMEPVWRDIYRKVKSAADAGTLVTTFDHPAVAQDLADAAVAHTAAAAHVDVAASAPDPATAQDNVAAATTAHQISAQKARAAASKQPPTVSPQLVQEAAKKVSKNPPPAQAPANEHIAHQHLHHGGAHRHAQDVHAEAQKTSEALYKETNARFWAMTHYKPGQKLDMSIPQDAEMAKIWRQIFHQVQSAADAGTLVLTNPDVPSAEPQTGVPAGAPPASMAPPPPPLPSSVPPSPSPSPSPFPPLPPLPGQVPPSRVAPPYGWGMMPHLPMYSMPPMRPPGMPSMLPPGMHPMMPRQGRGGPPRGHRRHRRPPRDEGDEGGEGSGLQPAVTAPSSVPSGPATSIPAQDVSENVSSSESPEGTPPMEETSASGLSGGKIALIVLGGLLGGTLLYVGVKHRASTAPSSGFQSRTPKAMPGRATVGRFGSGSGLPKSGASRDVALLDESLDV